MRFIFFPLISASNLPTISIYLRVFLTKGKKNSNLCVLYVILQVIILHLSLQCVVIQLQCVARANSMYILFIKVLKYLKKVFGVKKVVENFLPNFLLFFYFFKKWSRILFIKVLKSLRQLLRVKKVVAYFLPNFLFFFCFRKWSRILFMKVIKFLRQLFGAKVEIYVKGEVVLP